MASDRIPSRFVPTLTDVVDVPAASSALGSVAAVPAAAVAAPARRDAVAASNPVLPGDPGLEAAIADRVQMLLEERLNQALDQVLQDLRPLVREAIRQASAKR